MGVSHGGTFNKWKFQYKNWRNYYLMKIHVKPESGSGEGKCAQASFSNHVNEACDKGFVSFEFQGTKYRRNCGDNPLPLAPMVIRSLTSEMKIIYVVSSWSYDFEITTKIVDC